MTDSPDDYNAYWTADSIDELERFANLIAAAEREKNTALLRQCLESLILGAAIYPKESSIRPVFDTAITALLALLEGEQ